MKKFYTAIAALIVAVGGVVLFNIMSPANAALPRDCNSNSIINCGAVDSAELAKDYKANSTGDLDNIYSDYGLSSTEMTNASKYAKMGEVHKDGRVTVGGKTVATDAMSIGRKNIFSHSSKKVIDGKTYYNTAPKYSFNSSSIVAFVFFDKNGNFKSAVLTSCGNPVTAKPPVYKCNSLTKSKITRTRYSFTASASASNGATVSSYSYDFGDGNKQTSSSKTVDHTYAKPGTYKAKLTVNVKVNGTNKTVTGPQCEVTIVVEEEPEKPVYSCDSLTYEKISRLEYSFTGKATAEGGATITGYTLNYGDGKTDDVTNPTDVKHAYEKDGTYTVTLAAKVKVDGKDEVATSETCKVELTVSPNPPEECKPGVPVGDERCTPCDMPGKEHLPKDSPECAVAPVTELPTTGPAEIIGSILGLGSLVAAAYYWYASRNGLLTALLNR